MIGVQRSSFVEFLFTVPTPPRTSTGSTMAPKSVPKSTIPLPPSLRVRTTESQRHPGAPDKARSRRSTQEVQAEKAAKQKAILDGQKNREKAIAETARVENELEEQYQEKLRNANHPPPTLQKKVTRPRAATGRSTTAGTYYGYPLCLRFSHCLNTAEVEIEPTDV